VMPNSSHWGLGIGSALGSSLGLGNNTSSTYFYQAQQQAMAAQPVGQVEFNNCFIGSGPPQQRPMTFHEELQKEIDEWLRGVE
jgi:hypothetical protein